MEIVIKHFDELSASELHEIYKIRQEIFIVEQNCPYQDIDDIDKISYHLYLKDENGIAACIRVYYNEVYINKYIENAEPVYNIASIGRVVSKVRRKGYATELLKEGIKTAVEKFGADRITLEAQLYARKLYEGVGFRQASEEFLEDGIPHIQMMLKV